MPVSPTLERLEPWRRLVLVLSVVVFFFFFPAVICVRRVCISHSLTLSLYFPPSEPFNHTSKNKTMTQVGTNGYTAPELLCGERYGTPADVFSFAIVMCELATLQAPYADMLKGEDGEVLATWATIVALTKDPDVW